MSSNIPIKVERKENMESYYAESIQMVHSITGFKLIIFHDKAEYALDPSVGASALIPRSIVKEITAEVNFSPQQLKILFKVLGDQLKAYESRFGTISLPEQSAKTDNSSASFI
ncbi:MAG: hypothetical protein KGD64_11740 [Candidatus Heimdallarchaeota archaeon]|nr:hypothetical protein [Candidatus Heimdallarchaeota archaeon]